jgi:hypothetical protein
VPDASALRCLLVTYQRLIDEAAQAHHHASVVRRLVTIGPERFAVEHVRRSLATLERRYSAHAALADRPLPAATEDRERVVQFAASLPPPHSRLRSLAWVAGVLVVARAMLAVISALEGHLWYPWLIVTPEIGRGDQPQSAFGETTKPLADALTRLGDLSLTNLGEAVDVVFNSSLLTTSLVAVVFGFAAYVVLRPLITGAIAFRLLRHSGIGSRMSWYRHEQARAAQLRLDDHESAVFDAAGMRAPPDPWLDLAGKACVVAPLLIAATALWIAFLGGGPGAYGHRLHADGTTIVLEAYQQSPQDGVIALLLGSAAALRLGWLAVDARRRQILSAGRRRSWQLVLVLLPVLAITFGALAVFDHRPPSVLMVTPPWTMVASTYADPRLPRSSDRAAVAVRFVCDEQCDLGPGGAAGARFMSYLRLRRAVSTPTVDEGFEHPVPRSFWAAIPEDLQRRAVGAGIGSSAEMVAAYVYLTAEQARVLRPSPHSAPDKWLRLRVYDTDGNRNELAVAVRPKKAPLKTRRRGAATPAP